VEPVDRAAAGVSDGAATFRAMGPDDVASGLALCRQSGWNQTEADWRLLLEPPSVFQVAEQQGRVVGCAGAMVYGSELAWICMVLVERSARAQGLGTRLVTAVLERLPPVDAVGLDATAKGEPVYSRLGFTGGSAFARLETTASPATAPSGPRPITEADLPALLARDRAVFGADRGRILRSALAEAPEYAWCLGEGGARAPAYCLGRRGANAAQIGPVVASSPEAALDVVAAAVASHAGRRFFLDAPARGEWLSALEQRLGFREQRSFTRMYRGVAPRSRLEQSYAVFGPEFG
jgi:GNAT superfamily N-acetyltransferase